MYCTDSIPWKMQNAFRRHPIKGPCHEMFNHLSTVLKIMICLIAPFSPFVSLLFYRAVNGYADTVSTNIVAKMKCFAKLFKNVHMYGAKIKCCEKRGLK